MIPNDVLIVTIIGYTLAFRRTESPRAVEYHVKYIAKFAHPSGVDEITVFRLLSGALSIPRIIREQGYDSLEPVTPVLPHTNLASSAY